MKQSLKYGLFLVLALLIHVVSNEAMEDNCRVSPPTYRQEKCYVSQDHPVHNALERLHYFYSTQSCDMSHADVAHIPTDKSVQLLITYFREYKSQQNTSQTHSLHSQVLLRSYYILYIWFKEDRHLDGTIHYLIRQFITVGFIRVWRN